MCCGHDQRLLFDIQSLQNQLRSVKFLFAPRVCNKAAYLVTSFVLRFESEVLFNTLVSDVNVSVQI
ncbi:unnamed protein product [Malus baccata var. baccata]